MRACAAPATPAHRPCCPRCLQPPLQTVSLEDGSASFIDANGGRATVLIPDVKVGDNGEDRAP